MSVARWRVAVTRDDNVDDSILQLVEHAGFIPVFCPVLIEGPAPDTTALAALSRDLESFDWVICASARAVRAISRVRGGRWPKEPRTAAVGAMTAAAMRDAGAGDPVVPATFTATALWETLRPLDGWSGRRVLVTTVAGGRRELVDGLRSAGAVVSEVEAYSMVPRSLDDIRGDWQRADPDAVLLGSADTARRLIDAVGVDALRALAAVVPIGPMTASALAEKGIVAEPPGRATFADAIERLKSLLLP